MSKIAAVTSVNDVVLWDNTSSVERRVLTAAELGAVVGMTENFDAACVCFSSDGSYLAIATGLVVLVWNVENMENIYFMASANMVGLVAKFSFTNPRVLYFQHLDCILVWNITGGSKSNIYCATKGYHIGCFDIDLEDSLCVVMSTVQPGKVFSLNQSDIVLAELIGHTRFVDKVRFSLSGDRIASSSCAEAIVWDTRSGEILLLLPSKSIFMTDFRFASSCGDVVLRKSDDRLEMVHVTSGEVNSSFVLPNESIMFDIDFPTNHLFAVSGQGEVEVRDLITGELVDRSQQPTCSQKDVIVYSVCVVPSAGNVVLM